MKSTKNMDGIRAKDKGFTLVELLVTIAIVAVLASLAFMGFGRMRASGDKTVASNSLKQLQLANEMYASENSGVYVQAWSFDEEGNQNPAKWNVNQEFLSYFRGDVSDSAPLSVKRGVPQDMLDPIVVRTKGSRWKHVEKSYGINIDTMEGGRNNTPGSKRRAVSSRIKHPSRTCAFMTAQNPFIGYGGRYTYNGTENNTGNTTTAYRHGGKAIAVFFDGHIEMKSKKDMEAIDKEGGRKNLFWVGY